MNYDLFQNLRKKPRQLIEVQAKHHLKIKYSQSKNEIPVKLLGEEIYYDKNYIAPCQQMKGKKTDTVNRI